MNLTKTHSHLSQVALYKKVQTFTNVLVQRTIFPFLQFLQRFPRGPHRQALKYICILYSGLCGRSKLL